MPDPLTATALASAAVTLVTPYLAEAAKAGAKKAGEAAAAGVGALWSTLRTRLTSAGATTKVEKLEAAPEDPKRRTILAGELEELFEADPTFRAEIAKLVEELGGGSAVGEQRLQQVGRDNIGVQAVGDNKISIRGRGQST